MIAAPEYDISHPGIRKQMFLDYGDFLSSLNGCYGEIMYTISFPHYTSGSFCLLLPILMHHSTSLQSYQNFSNIKKVIIKLIIIILVLCYLS